jgi:hypothetical protein
MNTRERDALISPRKLAAIVAWRAPGIHRAELAWILDSSEHDPVFRRALAIACHMGLVECCEGYVVPGRKGHR